MSEGEENLVHNNKAKEEGRRQEDETSFAIEKSRSFELYVHQCDCVRGCGLFYIYIILLLFYFNIYILN